MVPGSVRTEVQLDGIEQFEPVASKNTEHSVVSAGDKDLVHSSHVGDPLRLLKTSDTPGPFAGLQVDNFY